MNTVLDSGFLGATLISAPAEQPEPTTELLSRLVDSLAHGVIVVSEHGQIIHANQAARVELSRRRVFDDLKGQIHAMSPSDGRALQKSLNQAAGGKRSLIKVSGSGASLMLAVIPLKPANDGCEVKIALFFARAEVCESGMVGFFARSYGLTQTEEQVLTILCRGLRTPEIAVQMKVAVSTVRSHVRSLCAKTSTSGVRELVNRVAVLPPVAPLHLVQIH